jgi:aryl-alcohol dehydrogenase-like predicted oxidoreductase
VGRHLVGARADEVSPHLDGNGPAVLKQLADLSDGYGVPMAALALAWLRAQPTVASPIASVSRADQLADLMPFAGVTIRDEDLAALNAVSAR